MRDPPAAVISDRNAAVWLALHQNPLGNYVVRHYLPLWRNLWLPAMNARVAGPFEWVVPADGTYRVVAARALLGHPWFTRPLTFSLPSPEVDMDALRSDVALRVIHNGRETASPLALKRGDSLAVVTSEPAAVFVTPLGKGLWFRQPPPGVTLDSEAARRTHLPVFRRLVSAPTPTSSARP
jgi:hypothetical protein